ncbi:MAG: hypothetical protein ACRD18_11015 [Terriglobia bacterium]
MSFRMALVITCAAATGFGLTAIGWAHGSPTQRGLSGEVSPPQSAMGPAQERDLIGALSDPHWQVRAVAARRLQSVPTSEIKPDIRRMLIALLARETAQLENRLKGTNPDAYPSSKAGEGWGEYYANLLGLVLKLREPASLPVLVSAAWQPSSIDIELATYGAPLIPVVLSRLSYLQRFAARLPGYSDLVAYIAQEAMADILTHMMILDKQRKIEQPLSPADYDKIRQALRPLLKSANDWVRLYASIGLIQAKDSRDTVRIRQAFATFLSAPIPGQRSIGLDRIAADVDEAEFIPMEKVKELAQADPYYYMQKTPAGKSVRVYPVRQSALRVLSKFQKTTRN